LYNSKDLKECYKIIEKGSHSFFAASKVLPKKVRDSAIVLYSFCRIVDDSIDETLEKNDALKQLYKRIELVYAGKPQNCPSDRCFSKLVKIYEMPKELPLALLQGMEWDANGKEYQTLSDLRSYCARVASTVGVMMCVLMRVRDRDILARACDLGVAMQLTNIVRDIGEDARNGRLYIPLDLMDRHGINKKAFLDNPSTSDGLGKIAKKLLGEAKRLYQRSESGLFGLPTSCQPGIYAARYIYEGIGKHIEAVQYDSINRRAKTSEGEKVTLLAYSFLKTLTSKILPVSAIVHAPPLREVKFLIKSSSRESKKKDMFFFSTKRLMEVLMELEENDKRNIYLSN
jgi:phytoene synthase